MERLPLPLRLKLPHHMHLTPAHHTAAHPPQHAAVDRSTPKLKRYNSCIIPVASIKSMSQLFVESFTTAYSLSQQHLVSEWMGVDKQERGPSRTPEPPPERPLRISSDPEVLATQLNSLPGMACSSHVYSTPKHYVRFSSPFLANRSPSTPGVPTGRRRSREMPETPPTTGSCKKVKLLHSEMS